MRLFISSMPPEKIEYSDPRCISRSSPPPPGTVAVSIKDQRITARGPGTSAADFVSSRAIHAGLRARRDYRIFGAGDPSDHCATGTIRTLIASGDSWNCGFSIGGAPGRSAPHVEPGERGK